MKVAEPLVTARRAITSGTAGMGTIPLVPVVVSSLFCAEIIILAATYSVYSQPIVVPAAAAELPQSGKEPK
jgi:hypothetical protein